MILTNYTTQWWVNGFIPDRDWLNRMVLNPDPTKIVAKNMVTIGSIDFSGQEGMYGALRESVLSEDGENKDKANYMIFNDTTHTVWVVWWGEEAK